MSYLCRIDFKTNQLQNTRNVEHRRFLASTSIPRFKIPIIIPTTKTSSISQRSRYIYIPPRVRKPFISSNEPLLRFRDERHLGGNHSIHPSLVHRAIEPKWRKCVAPFKKLRKATLSSFVRAIEKREREGDGERACRHTCTVSGGSTGLRGHLAIGHQSIV